MKDRYLRVGSQPTFYSGLDNLGGMSDLQKVEWLEGRLSKLLFVPLNELRVVGTTNEKLWDLNLGVVTLICTAIETMSTLFASKRKTDREKFVLFVERFMNPVYRSLSPSLGKRYSEVLYDDYRCGLSHGFTIEGHEVATRPEQYLTDENGYLSIDLWSLYEDAREAFSRYKAELERDPTLMSRFIRRFDKLFHKPYEKPA